MFLYAIVSDIVIPMQLWKPALISDAAQLGLTRPSSEQLHAGKEQWGMRKYKMLDRGSRFGRVCSTDMKVVAKSRDCTFSLQYGQLLVVSPITSVCLHARPTIRRLRVELKQENERLCVLTTSPRRTLSAL